MFEPAWSQRTVEDDPGAPFFNETTKYVVSSTLTEPTWRNSEVVGAYDPEAIAELSDRVEGDLYVSGSATLVRAMLADCLVDELHLFVFPLTRGTGIRLFPDGAGPSSYRSPPPRPTTTAWCTSPTDRRRDDARRGHGHDRTATGRAPRPSRPAAAHGFRPGP